MWVFCIQTGKDSDKDVKDDYYYYDMYESHRCEEMMKCNTGHEPD